MKVKELIAKLREYHDDYEVYIVDETVGVTAAPISLGVLTVADLLPVVGIACKQTPESDKYYET